MGIQRNDYVRGHQTNSLGWIKIKKVDSVSEYEEQAKALALLCGANALIKSTWVKESETYVKGRGSKGNPYFGTRHFFRGEALAVKAVKAVKADKKVLVHSDDKSFAEVVPIPSLVVLDGSNIAREAPQNVQRIICLAKRLREAELTFIFLFDANFAHVFGLSRELSKLFSALGLEPYEAAVVPSGSRADDFIIQFGERVGSVIVTNDLFRDQADRVKKLISENKIAKFLVIGESLLIPQLKLDIKVT